MEARSRFASGKSLSIAGGIARFPPWSLHAIVGRTALAVVALGAFAGAFASLTVALQGVPNPGVAFDPTATRVELVDPFGYAWRSGIRPGQEVVLLTFADESGGWTLQTRDGDRRFVASASSVEAGLRDSTFIAATAVGAGFLALLFLRTRRRWVLPMSAVALLLASTPISIGGAPQAQGLVLGTAAVVPGLWLAGRFTRPGIRIALGSGLGVLLVAWVAPLLDGQRPSDGVELARSSVAAIATVVLVMDRLTRPHVAGRRLALSRPSLVDVATVSAIAVSALLLMNVAGMPPLVVAVLMVVAAIAVPTIRRRLSRPIEDALFADLREAAAAEAAEEERGRLARELHDVPLQELAAVIRRLETVPGSEAEREDLRALAGHLRNVATELRPPVLDDLGLPAAIEFLADEATTPHLAVEVALDDRTGFGEARRPPAAVELAFFRIAREAIANAARHSRGTLVRVSGVVAVDSVELVIADDGIGLQPAAARDAARRKRLGLASMRRRAEAIDAEVWIDGTPRGTTVRVAWRR